MLPLSEECAWTHGKCEWKCAYIHFIGGSCDWHKVKTADIAIYLCVCLDCMSFKTISIQETTLIKVGPARWCQQDCSVDKGIYHQAWWPGLNPQDPHIVKRTAPQRCHVFLVSHTPAHIHREVTKCNYFEKMPYKRSMSPGLLHESSALKAN